MQWPVLAVPLLWALVALRPRRRRAPADDRYEDDAGGTTTTRTTATARPGTRLAGPRPAERTDTVERPGRCAVPPSSTSGDAAGPARAARPAPDGGMAWRM